MGPRRGGTIAIIGAGPYGLSIAAHLQFAGLEFRIFGSPMHRWLAQMPKGMFLKSEGCSSNLADPEGSHSLARYCAEQGLPYGEWGAPVPREQFVQYALLFQRKLVSSVEDVAITAIETALDGYQLRLSSGETLNARCVVVATGLEHTAYLVPMLVQLPNDLRSHTSDHHDLSRFKGLDVTVLGGGQSAIETAALLSEQGASVRLLVRQLSLVWNPVPKMSPRSVYDRLRRPRTGLGEGLTFWMYCNMPQLFHHLPQQMRVTKANTVLGPAGAWWLKSRVVGRFPILLGHSVSGAEVRGSRVVLHVVDNGQPRTLTTDHVISATGYRYDLRRLPFLGETLKSQLRHENLSPKLSPNFESSAPGLYFTGLASANGFGPMMRFLVGAKYTARRIASHLVDG